MKIITYIIGIIFLFVGILTCFLYINLFSFGYTLKEYLSYIVKLPEFICIIIGIVLIIISVNIKGNKK